MRFKHVPMGHYSVGGNLKKAVYQRWGVASNESFVPWTEGIETHDHLFFECPFASDVWNKIMMKNTILRASFT